MLVGAVVGLVGILLLALSVWTSRLPPHRWADRTMNLRITGLAILGIAVAVVALG